MTGMVVIVVVMSIMLRMFITLPFLSMLVSLAVFLAF